MAVNMLGYCSIPSSQARCIASCQWIGQKKMPTVYRAYTDAF